MERRIGIMLVMSLALAFTFGLACSNSSASRVAPPMPAAPPGIESSMAKVQTGDYANDQTIQAADRKIIRSGGLTLEVSDVSESIDKVAATARDLGGYVVTSNKLEAEKGTSGTISIRVPADKFDEAFVRLRRLARNVPYETTKSQDVTEEYTDLKAQLGNYEATERQYLALLARAITVDDILKVQRELSNVRGQIERIKGRMLYLERTTDMALIDVKLESVEAMAQTGWNAGNTLNSAARALFTFGRVVADLIVWIVVFGFWVWIPLLILWQTKWRKRKKQP